VAREVVVEEFGRIVEGQVVGRRDLVEIQTEKYVEVGLVESTALWGMILRLVDVDIGKMLVVVIGDVAI